MTVDELIAYLKQWPAETPVSFRQGTDFFSIKEDTSAYGELIPTLVIGDKK